MLVFLPHVMWNANHQWMTMRFQLQRGFTQQHLRIDTHQSLIWDHAAPDSPEGAVGALFF